ncbi:UNVERIFIED_CONTAM: hypothetical protein Slati_4491800 [Sesamum latifolium]|uniref:Uncharacterized protein n=1 Tax=Sesamum latifolium TaxID=2727402 RepID=A0AAW2SRP8_9LAMI
MLLWVRIAIIVCYSGSSTIGRELVDLLAERDAALFFEQDSYHAMPQSWSPFCRHSKRATH